MKTKLFSENFIKNSALDYMYFNLFIEFLIYIINWKLELKREDYLINLVHIVFGT